MLADMLLQISRPAEALVEYEASLKANPGRFNGLAGAAEAAEKLGKSQQAEGFLWTVAEGLPGSNSGRPELKHARLTLASKVIAIGGVTISRISCNPARRRAKSAVGCFGKRQRRLRFLGLDLIAQMLARARIVKPWR